jgi:hypothetical protein
MAKISLARALKIKKFAVGKLAELDRRLYTSNVYMEDELEFVKFRSPAVLLERTALRDSLITLKSAITVANAKIATQLVSLGEYKAYATVLAALPTAQRRFETTDAKGNTLVRWQRAFIEADAHAKLVADVRNHISDLQDEIDVFNAKQTIEIPDSVLEILTK